VTIANGHKEILGGGHGLEAGNGESARARIRVGSDTLASLKVNPDTGLARAEVDTPPERERLQRSGRKKGPPGSQIPKEVLGNLGVDARIDHGSVRRTRKIFRPHRGGRVAGYQRRVGLHAGEPGRRCR